MFIFVYSDFESFFRTYFALVILLSSDFCFSLLYLYPTVLSEHKKAFPAAQRERFWFVFCFIFFFMAIPHNSKCRYGERGVADAKPKAQIILDAAKVSAASGGNSEPKQGQRSQSARGFCPRSTMRVPQPDIIEHFGNADAVPQPPERCLSRKTGIVRCCLNKIHRISSSTGRCKHRPLQMFVGLQQIFTFLGGVGCPHLTGQVALPPQNQTPPSLFQLSRSQNKGGGIF